MDSKIEIKMAIGTAKEADGDITLSFNLQITEAIAKALKKMLQSEYYFHYIKEVKINDEKIEKL